MAEEAEKEKTKDPMRSLVGEIDLENFDVPTEKLAELFLGDMFKVDHGTRRLLPRG